MSAPAHDLHQPFDRRPQFGNVRPAKMAMWIFLLSDWFSFAGLLLGYGILRAESTVWHHPGQPSLNIPFTALLTLVLAVSSVTIIRAYDASSAGNRSRTSRWLGITATLGVLFLVGQYAEWVGIFHPGLLKEGLVFGQSTYAQHVLRHHWFSRAPRCGWCRLSAHHAGEERPRRGHSERR